MSRGNSGERQAVKSRRVMIYTLLLVLVFLYLSAKVEMRKAQTGKETGQPKAEALLLSAEEGPAGGGAPDAAWGGQAGAGDAAAGAGRNPEGDAAAGAGRNPEGDAAAGGGQNPEGDAAAGGRQNPEGDAAAGGGSGVEGADSGLQIRSEDMWALILTNAMYPIPEDYVVELRVLPGSEEMVDTRIYEAVVSMLEDMKAEGLKPIVCSAYRTLNRQEILFNRKLKNYVRQGYGMEEAYRETKRVLSIPGSGEHCLGLAVDIYSQSYQRLEEGFEKTAEGQWLREHCAGYGFILRYDRGKEEQTGIEYEPWHFRYVGVEAAKYITEQGLSLEEFYIEESLYG